MTATDHEHDRPLAGQGEQPLVPLAEAAALMGRHPEALRSMIRRGVLPAQRDNRRGWLVAVPPAVAGQEDHPAGHDRLLAGQEDAVAELRDEIAGLREALARSEAGRVAELKQAKAEAGERAAKAEAERDAAREALARELVRVDRLECELAVARRPWWQRWRGV